CRLDQSQPQRGADCADLVRPRPAARPRADRLAQARQRAAGTSPCPNASRQERVGEGPPQKHAPAPDLAAYAGDYQHPAYGVMSIRELDGALHWSWRGMFAAMIHRHYETFELPELPDRLLPDRLAITFLTDREGNIVSLSAPLEPMVR